MQSCTLHSAVPHPGRLLQQPQIASIGFTPIPTLWDKILASFDFVFQRFKVGIERYKGLIISL